MRTLERRHAVAALLALNDAIADGKDVSWIWDVDFEPLLAGAERLVVSGDRAASSACAASTVVFPEEALEVRPELAAALDRGLDTPPGASSSLPTYTAMLRLQRIVTDRGLAQPYWERSEVSSRLLRRRSRRCAGGHSV